MKIGYNILGIYWLFLVSCLLVTHFNVIISQYMYFTFEGGIYFHLISVRPEQIYLGSHLTLGTTKKKEILEPLLYSMKVDI